MSGPLSVPFAVLALFVEDALGRILFGMLAFVCLVVAAYIVWKKERVRAIDLEEKIRPKISLAFDATKSGCIVVSSFNAGPQAKWFRILAQASSAGSLNGCQGRLLSIQFNSNIVFDSEPVRLPFAPGSHPDAYSKEIRDGISEYLDVIFITEDNQIHHCSRFGPNSIDFDEIFSRRGEYKFMVAVSSSESRSVRYELILDWQGDWQSAKARGQSLEDSH